MMHSHDYRFSLSGLKTAVINYVHTNEARGNALDDKQKADLAASFTKTLVSTISSRLEKLITTEEKLPVVLAGGVAANSHLRKAVVDLCEKHGVKSFIPPLSLCGDNAAMIASQGYYEYISGNVAALDLNAYATKEV